MLKTMKNRRGRGKENKKRKTWMMKGRGKGERWGERGDG
jgi:hypothetical protein